MEGDLGTTQNWDVYCNHTILENDRNGGIDRQIDMDRQTDRQTDRKNDRQTVG